MWLQYLFSCLLLTLHLVSLRLRLNQGISLTELVTLYVGCTWSLLYVFTMAVVWDVSLINTFQNS